MLSHLRCSQWPIHKKVSVRSYASHCSWGEGTWYHWEGWIKHLTLKFSEKFLIWRVSCRFFEICSSAANPHKLLNSLEAVMSTNPPPQIFAHQQKVFFFFFLFLFYAPALLIYYRSSTAAFCSLPLKVHPSACSSYGTLHSALLLIPSIVKLFSHETCEVL